MSVVTRMARLMAVGMGKAPTVAAPTLAMGFTRRIASLPK
jgi:hypothetical protein